MLQVIGKGKVEHRPNVTPTTATEALQALAILAGFVATKGTTSERAAYQTVEHYLRTKAGEEKGVA